MAYLPILTYHRLLKGTSSHETDPARIAVTDRQFRAHMRWLKGMGYHTVGLNDYGRRLRYNEPHNVRAVAITFDDGYEEVLTLAVPILKEFGFTATIFAVTGQLGGKNVWDAGQERLLTAEQYVELDHAGVELGAHTNSHVHLPKMNEATARREITESKKHLEDLIGKPVKTLAYPYGESTEAIERMAQDAGFESAFATDRAPRDHADNLYRLRRVTIFPNTNLWGLTWKIQKWYPAYQDWQRR